MCCSTPTHCPTTPQESPRPDAHTGQTPEHHPASEDEILVLRGVLEAALVKDGWLSAVVTDPHTGERVTLLFPDDFIPQILAALCKPVAVAGSLDRHPDGRRFLHLRRLTITE